MLLRQGNKFSGSRLCCEISQCVIEKTKKQKLKSVYIYRVSFEVFYHYYIEILYNDIILKYVQTIDFQLCFFTQFFSMFVKCLRFCSISSKLINSYSTKPNENEVV